MSSGLVIRGRPIKVRHGEGHAFAVRIRDHELVVDQPRGSGGGDSGPTPTELFVASLAACVAHYGHQFLTGHGLSEDIAVEVDWSVDLGAERVAEMVLRVAAPAISPELTGAFQAALERCLVHNSLRTAPTVGIEIATVVGPA